MSDKFSYYDLLAHIVPGTLFLGLLVLLKNLLGFSIPLHLSSLLALGFGTALAYATGHVLQGISSFFERGYEYLWGGKPSIKMLSEETKHFTESSRKKMLECLVNHFDESYPETPKDHLQIFRRCMALVNEKKLGRVETFNASYAFHRVLLTTVLLSTVSLCVSSFLVDRSVIEVSRDTYNGLLSLATLALIGTVVEFFRTKQRSEYYAREVLDMAVLSITNDQKNREES